MAALLWGASLLTANLAPWAKYLCNSVMIVAFVLFAIRRERINIGGLVRSVLRRK